MYVMRLITLLEAEAVRTFTSTAGTIRIKGNSVWATNPAGVSVTLANFLPMQEGGSASARRVVSSAALKGPGELSSVTGIEWHEAQATA